MLSALLFGALALANPLLDELGRAEQRVWSDVFVPEVGGAVADYALAERLDRLGYRRVKARPEGPGEYFWGEQVFWVYRRAHRHGGEDHPDLLFGLVLAQGVVAGVKGADDQPLRYGRGVWIEPERLAEALEDERSLAIFVPLGELPEVAWRPLLALEDARFFEHSGVSGRAIARAALANAKAGRAAQGGSTLTQQLVKNRDLSARKGLDRKASEAVRALALEAEHDKETLLEAYLNSAYYGHVEGVGVYGIGRAARVYFAKDARDLSLAEGALLAAVVQGPNALSPVKNPEAARKRGNHALDRMGELGWASEAEIAVAKAAPLPTRLHAAPRAPARGHRNAVAAEVKATVGDGGGGGLWVETRLDPLLQVRAEAAVAAGLAQLARSNPAAQGAQAALVALDPRDGSVLASVGGDPTRSDALDRVTRAQRQPGSTVKPLVVLEALDGCAGRPLNLATRVDGGPLKVDDRGEVWAPKEYDGGDPGVLTLREALVRSANRPMVRVQERCGREGVARRLEAAGLSVPRPPPPSLALGSVEATPAQMAAAYTTFATPGEAWTPWSVARVEDHKGGALHRGRPSSNKVSDPASAWLVRDALDEVVVRGTGRSAAVEGQRVVGKTGTTNAARDAWFVGHSGGLVVAVWVGHDDGRPLGLTGGQAAAPIFASFIAEGAPLRPPYATPVPRGLEQRQVDPETGLLLGPLGGEGQPEWFVRGRTPPVDRPLRADPPAEIVR
jgi:membrane peptidoglycan carboxypeptidase